MLLYFGTCLLYFPVLTGRGEQDLNANSPLIKINKIMQQVKHSHNPYPNTGKTHLEGGKQ